MKDHKDIDKEADKWAGILLKELLAGRFTSGVWMLIATILQQAKEGEWYDNNSRKK